MTTERSALLDAMTAAAIEAGSVVQALYASDCRVEHKPDASPVTEADRAAEAVILAALRIAAPDIPVVAEEECAAGRMPDVGRRFLLVDPLDGTKEFLARTGDFTVNIALVEDGVPVLGVVYAPARGRLFVGDVAAGAWSCDQPPGGAPAARHAIAARTPHGALVVVGSRSHGSAACDAYLERIDVGGRQTIGSSLKFCMVAEGEADLYARTTPTMEWDTAAGHAVLAAAGGRVMGLHGEPFGYGKPGFGNPGFIACGRFDPPVLPRASIPETIP